MVSVLVLSLVSLFVLVMFCVIVELKFCVLIVLLFDVIDIVWFDVRLNVLLSCSVLLLKVSDFDEVLSVLLVVIDSVFCVIVVLFEYGLLFVEEGVMVNVFVLVFFIVFDLLIVFVYVLVLFCWKCMSLLLVMDSGRFDVFVCSVVFVLMVVMIDVVVVLSVLVRFSVLFCISVVENVLVLVYV